MSAVIDPVPMITEIRQIKNVKISTLHAKAERYRNGFVKFVPRARIRLCDQR
jgi:hypothetical protein